MTGGAFLFYHTHTPDSNGFEREVRNLQITTHVTDYIEVLRRLPAGIDAVFVKTDHWQTDPTYFHRLEDRIDSTDGSLERFDAHVCVDVDDSTGVIVNGVETSLRSQSKHVIVGGLPLDDDGTYHNLDLEELLSVGETADWIAPAHLGIPSHRFGQSLLEELFRRAEAADVRTLLGYTTGYTPLYNRLARNEVPFRTSVRSIAREFDVPLVPELDLHTVVPEGLSGCGVLDASAVDRLRGGELPLDAFAAADLFRPPGCRNGITTGQLARTYATFLPFVSPWPDPAARFSASLPETEWLRSIDVAASTTPLTTGSLEKRQRKTAP